MFSAGTFLGFQVPRLTFVVLDTAKISELKLCWILPSLYMFRFDLQGKWLCHSVADLFRLRQSPGIFELVDWTSLCSPLAQAAET